MSGMFPEHPVLLIDDESHILKSFELSLRSGGIDHLLTCQDSREVEKRISDTEIQAVVLDLSMPHISGEDLLKMFCQNRPHIPVIIITGNNEIDTAVNCMRTGAFDYILKPVDKNRLISSVQRAIEFRELHKENSMLKQRILSGKLDNPEVFSPIVTQNTSMHAVFQYAESIASSPHPVLITGETGVGKELMASAIHRLSHRKGAFVSVNVAGIDDNVFSDTLFGHVKGAFTGADNMRAGLVEKASRGTLFLDEIGDLRPESQVKLLRLLQEKQYFAVGSDMAKLTDARIIVTTNQNLRQMIANGRFRKDLYYRLNTHAIELPPLRQRLGDLPLLLNHFIGQTSQEIGKPLPVVPPELQVLLTNYHFPGNVRELKAMVHDAVSLQKSNRLSLASFEQHIEKEKNNLDIAIEKEPIANTDSFTGFKTLPTLEQANGMLIVEALKRCNNNQSMAARILGISRQRLARYLKNL